MLQIKTKILISNFFLELLFYYLHKYCNNRCVFLRKLKFPKIICGKQNKSSFKSPRKRLSGSGTGPNFIVTYFILLYMKHSTLRKWVICD